MEAATYSTPEERFDPDHPIAPEPVAILGTTDDGAILAVVRLADLQIDHFYQRELSNDLVHKISRNWDPGVAGAISVSRRANGTLWIIDGGHRSAAATVRGESTILCRIFDGLSARQEADHRLKGNVRRTDKPYERFRAQLAAGYEESIAIQGICESFDTRINPFPDQKNGINSVSAIEALYRVDQGLLLTRVFEVVRDAWGQVAGPTATVPVLKSIAFWLGRHSHDASRPRLIERLQIIGVSQLHRMAVNHRAISGGAMWTNYYRAIVEAYNDRLTPKNMLELRLGKAGQFMAGVDAPLYAEQDHHGRDHA